MIKTPKSHLAILLSLLCLASAATAYCFIRAGLSAKQTPPPEDIKLIPDIPGNGKPYHFDYAWLEDYPYIAHAFGGILGDSYTNSYEAFLLNYQLGQRVFEVDFYYTDDDILGAVHDDSLWRIKTGASSDTEFSHSNFRSTLIEQKYHALDYRQVIDLMAQYPDIYILTDTKYTDQATVTRQFSDFAAYAKTVDESVLDRFIVQIYHQTMLDWVMAVYPWKSVLYTLYADPTWTPENVVTFAETSGVKLITMWGHWVTDDLTELWLPKGINIAAHTINDYGTAQRLLEKGVSAIYTDFLLPDIK